MGLKIGNYDISQISVGNNKIGKVYYGNNLIYESRDLLAEYLTHKITKLSENDLAGIQYLGYEAFINQTALTEVHLPSTWINFDDFSIRNATSQTEGGPAADIAYYCFQAAFTLCSSLRTITFNNNALYSAVSLNNSIDTAVCLSSENRLIYVPKGVQGDITIPSNKYIKNDCFAECANITSLNISNVLPEEEEENIFINCSNCTSLTSFTLINNTAFSINKGTGIDMFYGCSSLTTVVIDGTHMNYMSGFDKEYVHLFSGCSSLTTVTLPTIGGTYEDTYPFIWGFANPQIEDGPVIPAGYYLSRWEDDGNITWFLIPETLTSVILTHATDLSFSCFRELSSLTSLTLNSSLNVISQWALRNCTNLTRINFNGTTAQWNAINKDAEWHDGYSYDDSDSWTVTMPDITIYCTDGTVIERGQTWGPH